MEAAAAGPVTREVGRMMASTPGVQTLTGATGGAAGAIAKEAGAGPVGQIAATIGGAVTPSIPSMVKSVTQQVAKKVAPAKTVAKKAPAKKVVAKKAVAKKR